MNPQDAETSAGAPNDDWPDILPCLESGSPRKVYVIDDSPLLESSRFQPHNQPRITGMNTISSIDKLTDYVAGKDYISFDLFDTLLKRRYLKVNEVHDTVSAFALAQIGRRHERSATDLTLLRYRMSDALKSSTSAVIQEPPIEMVWDRILSPDAPHDAERAALVQEIVDFEHAIEMRNLGLVEGARDLLVHLKSQGKTLIAISDMYFSFVMMKDILDKLGIIDLFDHIYISVEANLTKHTGDLFKRVLSDLLIEPHQLLHVGDNHHSDVSMAIQAGIVAVLVAQADLLAIERPAYGKRERIEEEVAALVKAHLFSLLLDARNRRAEYIYFMGRDGCAISRFLQEWSDPFVTRFMAPPAYSDLFLNRILTCWGGVDFSGNWLLQAIGLAFWLNHGEATAPELSALLGIDAAPFSLGSEPLHSSKDTERTVQAYRDEGLEDAIRISLVTKRESVLRHLKDIGFFEHKSTIFSDVGYSGTVLRDLNSLFMQSSAGDSVISPPKMALHLIATNDNYSVNRSRARPFVEFSPQAILPSSRLPESLKASFAWLEFFFKHPTVGPILRFIDANGRLLPELVEQDIPAERFPSQRVEAFATAQDEDIALLWMASIDFLGELVEPIIDRFAKPDRHTVDQMMDEVFELHSVKGARRSIILKLSEAQEEIVASAAREGDYWIPGSVLMSAAASSQAHDIGQALPIEEVRPSRKRTTLARLLRRSADRAAFHITQMSQGFDPRFYGSFYPDLRHLKTDLELWRHYAQYGKHENRLISRDALVARLQAEFGPIPADFDDQIYLYRNPDLASNCDTPERALDHFMRSGRNEGRIHRPFFPILIEEFERLRAQGAIQLTNEERERWERGDTTMALYLERHAISPGFWVDQLDIAEFRALHSSWCGLVTTKAECIVSLLEKGLPKHPSLSLHAPFDPEYYRGNSSTLSSLSPEELYRHYLNFGSSRGFPPSEQADLMRIWGHAEFPEAFAWQEYQASRPDRLNQATRADVLKVFLDTPGIERLSFVKGENAAQFIEFLASRAWRHRGQLEEARNLYHAALEMGGSPGRIRHFLGDLALQSGNTALALNHYSKGIVDSAADRWSYLNASELSVRNGSYSQALAYLAAGKETWRSMAPWRRLHDRALHERCRTRLHNILAQRGRSQMFGEADALVQEIADDLPVSVSSAFDGVANGALVLTMRPASSARQDKTLSPGVTVYDLLSIEQGDFLGAMLRHEHVILHEVPFTFEALRAICIARSLGKPTIAWFGNLLEWQGHALDQCEWGENGEAWSPLRQSSFPELALVARYCSQVVTTLPGCTPHLSMVAPDVPIQEYMPATQNLRGERTEKRVILVAPLNNASSQEIATIAAAIRNAAIADRRLTFLIDDRLRARRELREIAGRWAGIDSNPELPSIAATIETVDAVLQLLDDGQPYGYSFGAEARARGIPELEVRRTSPAGKEGKGQIALTLGQNLPIDAADLGSEIVRLAGRKKAKDIVPTTGSGSAELAAEKTTSHKKKILFVNIFFSPQTIGGATRVLQDNVDYILDHHSDEFDLSVFSSDDQNDHCGEFTIDSYRGIPVFRVATPQEINMDWRPFNPMVAARFAAVLDSFQPDIVHIHCLQRLSVTVAEVCRARNVPYYVTLHDAWWISDFPFLSTESGLPAVARQDFLDQPRLGNVDAATSARRAQRLRSALLGAERRFAVSKSFAALYAQCGIDCETIENGTSRIAPFPRTQNSNDQLGRVALCHVGGLEHHKGAYLIEAALRTTPYKNLHFTVVDLARRPVDETHAIWGTTPVTITGKMTTEEIARFYARMNVLLAPSTWPESYGLVTREALAHGLWVVASDQGAMGDPVVHGRNGFVVPVTDASGVARALSAIDDSPALYRRSPPLTGSIRSADDQARELVEIYRSTGDFRIAMDGADNAVNA